MKGSNLEKSGINLNENEREHNVFNEKQFCLNQHSGNTVEEGINITTEEESLSWKNQGSI